MKKTLKIILIVLFGIITVFIVMQSTQSKEALSTDADFNFVKWSNSISEEEAKAQLKDFLSSNFNNWEEAEAWLIIQGLDVKSSLLSEESAKIFGIENPAFSVAAYWNPKKQGIIFSNGWLFYLESVMPVHSVSIEILYTDIEKIAIHNLVIIKSRL